MSVNLFNFVLNMNRLLIYIYIYLFMVLIYLFKVQPVYKIHYTCIIYIINSQPTEAHDALSNFSYVSRSV